MTTFPVTYQRPGHGNLVAHNDRDAAQWEAMGWIAIPNEPATYGRFPLMAYGPPGSDLPGLIVENDAEAKAAAQRGYVLPSDDDLEDAEEAFGEAFVEVDEAHDPQQYPKVLYHPDHRLAIPQRFDWLSAPPGHPPRVVAAVPEAFPPVVVSNLQDEGHWRLKGWMVGASPSKKLSGAARRKLARQQLAEQEIADAR
jgi:hypothetical protein